MSTVRQLAVRGLRSFGPDDQDQQHIVFSRPLTLILGENGCGKTTLLEALKFALCDELPPNSDHGKSFVHDPQLAQQREVLGQVRLEFSDNKKCKYLVARSVQTQMKQKKMQFQRLDNYIKTVKDNNEIVEISGRCSDTNNTIASILGVSKAVLNNVIFCHQEESNWPLDEGKKLKERFDAIFDTTKYNKCLEHVKKLRKQYATEIKLLEQSVEYFLEKKQECENKKKNLFNNETKTEEASAKLEDMKRELEPITKRLQEIDIIENNIMKIKTQREMAKTRIEACIKQKDNLKRSITTLYEGSMENLQQEIKTFQKNLEMKESKLNECVKNGGVLQKKETQLNKQISDSEIKSSQLFTLEGQNQEKISKRNKDLINIANFIDISVPMEIDDDDNASELFELIKSKLDSLQYDLKLLMNNAEAEDKRLQKIVDNSRDALTKHKETINSKGKELIKINGQIIKIKKNISDANESKSKLDDIKKRMDMADENIEDISRECNVEESETQINNHEKEISKLETELDALEKMINKMQLQQSKLTEINLKKVALTDKQKTFTRIKNKNKEAMTELVGDKIPENNFKRTFQNCKNSLKSEVEDMQKQLKLKQSETTQLESNRNHTKSELDKKKRELSNLEEQIYKLCKTSPLDDVLKTTGLEIDKLQDQKIEFSSSEFVIKKFMDKLEDTDPACPLCHRSFDNQQEVSDLITELQDKVRNVPKKLEAVLTRLNKFVKDRDELIGLRPLNEKVLHLKNDEIPSLEKKLKQIDTDLQDTRNCLEDYQMSLIDPETKLATAESMLSDMPLLDQLMNEISIITNEVSKLESSIGAQDNGMSLEESSAKQAQLKKEISNLRISIKSKQLLLNKHNSKINKAREKKNSLKEEYLQAQSKIQELVTLQKQYDEIIINKEKLETEVSLLTESTSEINAELTNAEKNKSTTIEKLRNKIEKDRSIETQLDKRISSVMALNKEIDKHKSKGIPGELNKLKNTLENLNRDKEKVSKDIKTEAMNMSQIKDDISNQSLNKRNLDDNLSLRTLEKEEQGLEDELKNIEDKAGELNYDSINKEQKKWIRSKNDIIWNIGKIEGELKTLKENVKQIKLELMQKQYKDVDKEYKKLLYELDLMKTADKDIKDYAFAMDYCLMKFHKDKMEKINFIIRDLWRSIYRGNDIDYIEIKTDESTSNAGNSNRRVYDYRVVQKRNDVEIDMRGRCSAGQKVLACLIIRMALAETFSNRFGVLALDEPTTNLDKENVMSLCCALRDMVISRMKQSNFMFIIITHDAEFLTSLGRIDKLRHYYRVTRNQNGKSRITKESMA